jgi:cobalamin biosynthetic protein CobC
VLEHGGQIARASRRYGIPCADWLDLSTGINPTAWPVSMAPAESWARLPEADDGLDQIAAEYYGAPIALAVPGTQAAIQALPRLRAPGKVVVVAPIYEEHAHRWALAGHEVSPLGVAAVTEAIRRCDVVVVVNPNNPDGRRIDREMLLDWNARLAARGGWLVVDEAFADANPAESLAPDCGRQGLLVLRSFGKFFGLAGVRLGFVLAKGELLGRIAEDLGPWAVAGPTRHLAKAALADRAWQAEMRWQLRVRAGRLAKLLERHGLSPCGGCALFQWVPTADAMRLRDRLAERGILVRAYPEGLRFGLPGPEAAWARLEGALAQVAAVESPL